MHKLVDVFAYNSVVDEYLSSSRKEASLYDLLEAYKVCADAFRKALEMGRRESNAEKIVREYSIGVCVSRQWKFTNK